MTAEVPALPAAPRSLPARFSYFSIVGLLIAASGLGLAATGFELPPDRQAQPVEAAPPPPPEKPVEEADRPGVIKRTIARVFDKKRKADAADEPSAIAPPEPPVAKKELGAEPWLIHRNRFMQAGVALGIVGTLLGIGGWVRREEPRLAFSAMTFGALSVGWAYLVIGFLFAMGVVIILLVLYWLARFSPAV